jgi:hypothetical protein
MTIFGKSLSEYISFQKDILWFITIVGLGRLALSLAGVPNSTTKFVSVTVAVLLSWFYVSYKVHKKQFGSYKQLLPLVTIQNLWANIIIAGAIALAIFTGKGNIFTAVEYSGGRDGGTWSHIGAHLILATIVLSIVGWGIGSLILYLSQKVSPNRQLAASQDEGRGKAAGASAK